MFKIGDVVRNVAANVVGVVVETDGDRVYFEQDNGAEVDFAASALVLESDFQAKHVMSAEDAGGSSENDPACKVVLDNLYPAIIALGRQAHAQVRNVPGVKPKNWDDLTPSQQLNAVSKAAGVSVETWMEANQPGAKTPLGTLQLSILAAAAGKA